jgi:putative flavoprotein involved in K+ transport
MSDASGSANERASAWLKAFEAALQSNNTASVTALFDDDCYWRDMLSFTWNIKTQEGKPAIAEMLTATLGHVRPQTFALDGDATGDAAMTEAWITFETAVARGYGHLRLKEGKGWTLLTTMRELKGHEEKRAQRGPKV